MVIYVTINLMRVRGELLKEDDKGKLRKIAHCLEDWINKKKCSDTSSDIVFCVMSVVFPFRGCCSFLFGLFRNTSFYKLCFEDFFIKCQWWLLLGKAK